MSNDTNQKIRKAGRPNIQIAFPEDEFTVEMLETKTGLSKVTIYKKVKEAVKNNVITACGVQKTKGRPETLFKKVSSSNSGVPTSNVQSAVAVVPAATVAV